MRGTMVRAGARTRARDFTRFGDASYPTGDVSIPRAPAPSGPGLALAQGVLRWFALALLGGCIVPYAIPPVKAEIGGMTSVGRHDPALHAAGGVHLASATQSHHQKFDLGIGGFGDWPEHGPTQQGGYVDGALFVDDSPRTRTSLGFRGELRWAGAGVGTGAKLRIDHELYGTSTKNYTSSDHCGAVSGAWFGTAAVGLFAEAGRVWMPDNASAWTATAGLSLRLPVGAGVYLGIPGCD